MGGHMRSLFGMAKLPPKSQPQPAVDRDEDQQQQKPKIMKSSSSISFTADLISNTDSLGSPHSYKVSAEVVSKPLLRSNLIVAALYNNGAITDLSTDQYFPFGNYNGSLRNQTPRRRRSKRLRRTSSLALLTLPSTTRNQLSSSPSQSTVEVNSNDSNNISDPPPLMSDEQLALCLLALSKDKSVKRTKKDPHDQHVIVDKYKNFGDKEEDEDGEKDIVIGEDIEATCEVEEEDDDELFTFRNVTKRRRISTKKKLSSGGGKYYKCETCNKYFPSYQALGGHRASHTHTTKKTQLIDNVEEGSDDDIVPRRRSFECPFCDKVFESGRAIGGHKKVHFSYLGIVSSVCAGAGVSSDTSTTADIQPTTKCSLVVAPTTTTHRNVIDLNLPPPIEDEDDDNDEIKEL